MVCRALNRRAEEDNVALAARNRIRSWRASYQLVIGDEFPVIALPESIIVALVMAY